MSDPLFDSDTQLILKPNWMLSLLNLPWWSHLQTLTFHSFWKEGAYHSHHPHAHILYILQSRSQKPKFFLQVFYLESYFFLNYRWWLWQVSTIAIVHTTSAGTSQDLKIQNHLQRELGYNESEDNLMVKNSCIKEKMMPICLIWITHFLLSMFTFKNRT